MVSFIYIVTGNVNTISMINIMFGLNPTSIRSWWGSLWMNTNK